MHRLLQSVTALCIAAMPLTAQTADTPEATSDLSASTRPVVVELFTSQGCSACPPADEMLVQLARRDDVIAIALHVDYWDYIGWADEFAAPEFTDRQRGYARRAGRRSIYTPQMVVNGQSDIVGARPMELSKAIEHHRKDRRTVALDLKRDGATLTITGQAMSRLSGPVDIHVLRYIPVHQSQIPLGENAGHTIDYANVAQNWQTLGPWDGAEDLSMTVPLTGDLPVVVLVQDADHGKIVAAAELR